MVGNGVTDWEYDTTPAFIEMAYWFGMYEDELYYNIKQNCNFSYFEFTDFTPQCEDYYRRISDLTI